MFKSIDDQSRRLYARTEPINVKRHTKPCIYFQTNSCPLSADMCDFAHIFLPKDPENPLKMPQATLRTKPCKFYTAGSCKQGVWCRFKHPASSTSSIHDDDNTSVQLSPSSWDDEMLQTDSGINSEEDEADDTPDIRDIDPSWRSRQELHPKYRTRPCRNFISGKCPYGDSCSYVHVLPDALTRPSIHRLEIPQSPEIYGGPVTPGGFSSPPYIPNVFPSPSQESSLSPTLIKRHGLPTMPPPIFPTSPQSAYPTSQSPVTYLPIPVPVPAYPIYTTPSINEQQLQRPRSASHPSSRSVSAQKSIYYRTKTCKFYATTGQCSLGDKCTFIHSPTIVASASTNTSEMSGSQSSSSGDITDTERASNSSERSERKNFYKINWRVVGGGVMIGKKKDEEASPAKDKHKAQDSAGLDSIICAFHPTCPHGDTCSFRHIDPTSYRIDGTRHSTQNTNFKAATVPNSKTTLFDSIMRMPPNMQEEKRSSSGHTGNTKVSISNPRKLSIPIPPIDSFFKNSLPTITPRTARPNDINAGSGSSTNIKRPATLALRSENDNRTRFAKSTPSTPVSASTFPKLFPAESP